MRRPKPHNCQELLDFLLLYGKQYLASGGPTSRLEEGVESLGRHFGYETEVFATPTGLFITLKGRYQEARTALTRIREMGTNLSRLCILEKVFQDIMDNRISVHAGLETLKSELSQKPQYAFWQTALAAFFTGFVISFNYYQRAYAAAISGVIAFLCWFLMDFLIRRRIRNPIFTDFSGALFTLVAAAFVHILIAPLSVEAYSLGGLVLLVPGLALTTAIAELADQNLVSGTAKFMQAFLALLALGLAYLLFQQLAYSLHLRSVLLPAAARQSVFWISLLSTLANVVCFGVILRVPPRSLLFSAATGLAGWLALFFTMKTPAAVAAPYVASTTVGIVSLSFGRLFRLPSQVYSVPGIVAMLPGMLALSSFRYFASGDQESGLELGFKVTVTAVSIVFGLMTARLPFLVRLRAQRT